MPPLNIFITSVVSLVYQSCSLFSLSSDPTLNHPRRRHSSGNISTTLEMLPGLEGFQLEAYGRVDKNTLRHPQVHVVMIRRRFIFPSLSLSVSVSVVRPVPLPHQRPGEAQAVVHQRPGAADSRVQEHTQHAGPELPSQQTEQHCGTGPR